MTFWLLAPQDKLTSFQVCCPIALWCGYKIVSFFHVTSENHEIKELCDFKEKSPLRSVTNGPTLADIGTLEVEI